MPRQSSRLRSQRLHELAAAEMVTRQPDRAQDQLTATGEGLREPFAAPETCNAQWNHSGTTTS